jgi:LacI family transcriptional regulator
MTALGAMRAFIAHGLRVPEDISVIGFDNIPYCEISVPALTTIDQHAYEMGELSARLLIERIAKPRKLQYSVALAPTLVVRSSVSHAKVVPGTHLDESKPN